MKKIYLSTLLLLVSAFALATTHSIQVSNFSFSPSIVNATVGDTVHFNWIMGSHTTTCNGTAGSILPTGATPWNANINSNNQTFDYVLTTPGSYTYVCLPHSSFMTGMLNVQPAVVTSEVFFRVDMSNEILGPGGVHIAGSFNGFSATASAMTPIGNNVYETSFQINSGQAVEYVFLKDSTFTGQELVPPTCGVPNGFGGFNRFLTVPANDTTLLTVCYSSCAACPAMVDVILRVDMTNETIAPGGVHLAGSFNNWSATATPMQHIGNNVYRKKISVASGSSLLYTFLKDSTYNGQELVPAACGVPNGFGGYNRNYNVPANNSTLPIVCYSSCTTCVVQPPSDSVMVTFRVDMSQTTLCPGGPHIAGSFNNWSPTASPMTAIGNGVYEITLQLDSTLSYQYKFLKDSTWACGDETVPAACAVFNNREIEVPETNVVLPTVCFSSCTACVVTPPSDSAMVTFRVDISQTTLCPGGPHIAGSFNNWSASATPMTAIGNGVYEVVLMLDTTMSYQYKFLKDSTWACGDETVPAACAVNNNREIVVPELDTILPTVCFGSCAPCQIVPNPTVDVTFRVDISQHPCTGGGPHLVGSFNGWNATATPMTSVGAGVYEATVSLDTTLTVQYKFLNDSAYSACGNENVPAACGVPNGFGGFNRQIEVPEANNTLPTVCFGSCVACIPPNMVNVTFRVDMAFTTLGPGGVHLAGTFNSFNAAATPMINVGGSVYAATILLDTTTVVEYTFLKDSTFNGQEVITALCGVPNGFGGFNRQLMVPETDSTLIAYCYSSCFTCNVGINDVDINALKIYPNPSHQFINVELPVNFNQGILTISNVTGDAVLVEKINQNNTSINISHLANGVYAIHLQSDAYKAVTKLIKK